MSPQRIMYVSYIRVDITHNISIPPMPNDTPSTMKHYAYIILYPQGVEISDERLQKFITPDRKDWLQVWTHDWLYYTRDGEEDMYAWQLPGIKLVFNDEVLFDIALDIANEVVAALTDEYGAVIERVLIDRERMAEMG
jgi:hypothetical protein